MNKEASAKVPSTLLLENFDPPVLFSTVRSKFSCRLVSGTLAEASKVWYLLIFLVPLVINPWGLQLYGSGKVFWFFAVLGVFLGWFAMKGKLKLPFNGAVYLYLALWVISFLLSTVFSLAPVQSFFGEYTLMQGSLFYLFVAAHFLICLKLFSDKKLREVFFWLVKWIGVLAAVFALLLWTGPEYSNRIFGASGQPNFLAQFLIFPLFVACFDLKERRRLVDIFVLLLLAAAVYLTGSRAVMLGIIVAGWLMALLVPSVKRGPKIVGTLVLLLLMFFGYFGHGLDMRSVNSRFFLWKGALQTLDFKNVWLGSGEGTFYRQFAEVMPKEVFENEQFYRVPESPHNEFLEALTERGIFGAMVYLIPLVFLLMLPFGKRNWKFCEAKFLWAEYFALVAYYVSVQFSFSVVEHWVFLAAFWAILLLEVLKFKTVELRLWRWLVLPVSFFLIIFSVLYLRGDILLAKGVASYIETPEKSYGYFEDAADSLPFFAYPRKFLVDFFGDDEVFVDRVTRYLAAYGKITGNDFDFHVLAMKVAPMGDFDWHYRQARSFAPNLPIVYTVAGDRYFEAGDCARAREQYKLLEALAPSAYFGEGERKRLFEKHAGQFVRAMARKMECEK